MNTAVFAELINLSHTHTRTHTHVRTHTLTLSNAQNRFITISPKVGGASAGDRQTVRRSGG